MTRIQTVPEKDATGVLKEVYDAWVKLMADMAGLRAAGFADLDILDITLLTCYRNFINRLGDALGVVLDETLKTNARLVAGIEAAMGPSR